MHVSDLTLERCTNTGVQLVEVVCRIELQSGPWVVTGEHVSRATNAMAAGVAGRSFPERRSCS